MWSVHDILHSEGRIRVRSDADMKLKALKPVHLRTVKQTRGERVADDYHAPDGPQPELKSPGEQLQIE